MDLTTLKNEELIAHANALGAELDSRETKADLVAKIEARAKELLQPKTVLDDATAAKLAELGFATLPSEDQVPAITRARFNRGSTRRVVAAATNLMQALDDYAREMDRLVFAVDEDGKRSGPWPFLGVVRAFRDDVNKNAMGLNQMEPPAKKGGEV